MSLLADTYKEVLLKTKRGNCRGKYSNAKPIFLLSIIDAIEEGVILGNKIAYDCKQLRDKYRSNYVACQNDGKAVFRANSSITPFCMPFFHLNAEPYYHIKWINAITPPPQAQSPSDKYLRTNVDYAFLDDELWELLQNADIRAEYRQSIVKNFLALENN